ncbi:MAG TPA: hypothetical protein VFH39_03850 [Candidatus Saccharimonadales bacterium]|nr:hypothetical protein [Candidatus Saccharimonadales bacterium]
MNTKVLMLSRLHKQRRATEISLKEYPLAYEPLPSEAKQRKMWRLIARRKKR